MSVLFNDSLRKQQLQKQTIINENMFSKNLPRPFLNRPFLSSNNIDGELHQFIGTMEKYLKDETLEIDQKKQLINNSLTDLENTVESSKKLGKLPLEFNLLDKLRNSPKLYDFIYDNVPAYKKINNQNDVRKLQTELSQKLKDIVANNVNVDDAFRLANKEIIDAEALIDDAKKRNVQVEEGVLYKALSDVPEAHSILIKEAKEKVSEIRSHKKEGIKSLDETIADVKSNVDIPEGKIGSLSLKKENEKRESQLKKLFENVLPLEGVSEDEHKAFEPIKQMIERIDETKNPIDKMIIITLAQKELKHLYARKNLNLYEFLSESRTVAEDEEVSAVNSEDNNTVKKVRIVVPEGPIDEKKLYSEYSTKALTKVRFSDTVDELNLEIMERVKSPKILYDYIAKKLSTVGRSKAAIKKIGAQTEEQFNYLNQYLTIIASAVDGLEVFETRFTRDTNKKYHYIEPVYFLNVICTTTVRDAAYSQSQPWLTYNDARAKYLLNPNNSPDSTMRDLEIDMKNFGNVEGVDLTPAKPSQVSRVLAFTPEDAEELSRDYRSAIEDLERPMSPGKDYADLVDRRINSIERIERLALVAPIDLSEDSPAGQTVKKIQTDFKERINHLIKGLTEEEIKLVNFSKNTPSKKAQSEEVMEKAQKAITRLKQVRSSFEVAPAVAASGKSKKKKRLPVVVNVRGRTLYV